MVSFPPAVTSILYEGSQFCAVVRVFLVNPWAIVNAPVFFLFFPFTTSSSVPHKLILIYHGFMPLWKGIFFYGENLSEIGRTVQTFCFDPKVRPSTSASQVWDTSFFKWGVGSSLRHPFCYKTLHLYMLLTYGSLSYVKQ